MGKKNITSLKVAAAYIGTVVGAGFATGQEILQFFAKFGIKGLTGILFSSIMFILFGYIIMDLGERLDARSHLEIIMHSNHGITGTIIDMLITFFLFGSFTSMIAGTGALFIQQFNMSSLIGNVLMAAITAITVLTGITGVINSISFVVPFLLAAVTGISLLSIKNSPLDFTSSIILSSKTGILNNWLLSSVLYVSYNIITSVAILGPLGAEAKNKKAIKIGAILGGLGLGLGSVMIFLALSANISEINNLEVPMIYIAGKISYTVQLAYAVVLIAEIYTTAVGSLYGFVSRITDVREFSLNSVLIVTLTSMAALLASQFGFSNLVKYYYPLVGYSSIIFLICLLRTNTDK